MIKLPTLVQDAPIVRMTNSVLVGTMKFTRDQIAAFFTTQNPPPSLFAQQLSYFRSAYDAMNAAYALTRESLLTQDISSLDEEGDQLYLGAKETVEAARRMTYVVARKEAGDRLWVFMKKYDVNVKENMISEWSKLQQMTEEANASTSLTADLATLGLTEMWARLTDIAEELRDKLTARAAEMPAQKAMKLAREALYPEYRALIQLLNAFALTDSDTTKYASLISALNANIDYVRIHAMTNGGATSGGSADGGSDSGSDDSGGGDSGGGDSGGGDSGGGDSGGGGDEPSGDVPGPD